MCKEYKERREDKSNFFENQNKEIASFGISLNDIDIDFDKMVEIYNSNSELKNELTKQFYHMAHNFNINLEEKVPTGSSMGE